MFWKVMQTLLLSSLLQLYYKSASFTSFEVVSPLTESVGVSHSGIFYKSHTGVIMVILKCRFCK